MLRKKKKVLTACSAALLIMSSSLSQAQIEKDADGEFLINGIIVKYKESYASKAKNELKNKARSATGEDIDYKSKGPMGTHLLKVKKKIKTSKLKKITDKLMKDPDVIYAEPDYFVQHMMTPNDSEYYRQWHYSESTGGAKLPNAWDRNTGSGAVVAVIDTGVLSHADLSGNLLPGYDFVHPALSNDGDGWDSDATDPGDWYTDSEGVSHDSSWHGTHVAGTVAATTNNYSGVAGVAHDAKIVPVRVLGQGGGFISDIAYGMNWAVGIPITGAPTNNNPADVLNLSLGGPLSTCSVFYQHAIEEARDRNAVVIVAAGNSDTDASGHTPANCADAITVASSSRSATRAYYSNYGSVVDISAPGGDQSTGTSDGVYSTSNSGSTVPASDNYEYKQGTSMAAPHASGVAALLYSQNPDISNDTVELILPHSAKSRQVSGCSNCGSGILDAEKAISMVCTSRNYSTKELRFMDAYLAYYGRVPDPSGLDWHVSKTSGNDITPRMPVFLNSGEFTSVFGVNYNSVTSAHYAGIVDQIYLNIFGHTADTAGRNFYVGKLNAGTSTINTIGLEILDAAGSSDKTTRDYRLEVARSYVDQQKDNGNATSPSASDLRNVVSIVSNNDTDVLDGCSAAHDLVW